MPGLFQAAMGAMPRSLGLPLNPQQLTGGRQGSFPGPGPSPQPGMRPGARQPGQGTTLPPSTPGMPGTIPGPFDPSYDPTLQGNPFQGNRNPGVFTTPAPFNPLLAQALIGRFGGMGPATGGPGMFPRGPLGSFTPGPEMPRKSRSNPYQS